MNPGILKFGLLGVAGYAIYKIVKSRQPTASDYQSVPIVTATGVPGTVATPVSATITYNQAEEQPISEPVPVQPQPIPGAGITVSVPPVPTTIPGVGVTFAPPNSVEVTPSGVVTQMAPIIATPQGAASIAVGTTKDVQRALNTLGYMPKLDEDGKLGPKTTANIKAFQSKNGITPDGIAGPITKSALSAALVAQAAGGSNAGATAQLSAPQTGIAISPSGAAIDTKPAMAWTTKDVQHALNVLGASPKLAEDGQTGPKTVAAIKSYQTSVGLTPDGIAGPKTKTALYLSVAQASVTSR
jgi:peptidoglycan hydrolase-like protein with peptidoglycan-binding domain